MSFGSIEVIFFGEYIWDVLRGYVDCYGFLKRNVYKEVYMVDILYRLYVGEKWEKEVCYEW